MVAIVDTIYDLEAEVADDFIHDMHMRVDRLLPDWNYVLLPS